MPDKVLRNNIAHSLFEITVLVKGFNGLWETLVGLFFFFFNTETIYHGLLSLSESAVASASGSFTANYLTHTANNFSHNTKYFLAWYFLLYGITNIFLAAALMKGRLWAYPAAIIFFITFIVYQLYRFFSYRSGLLLAFTIFDVFLVFLTWVEYKRVSFQSGVMVEE